MLRSAESRLWQMAGEIRLYILTAPIDDTARKTLETAVVGLQESARLLAVDLKNAEAKEDRHDGRGTRQAQVLPFTSEFNDG
jgi:hypothetical protein